MTEVSASGKSPSRNKRVKRLKKIILGGIVTLIVIPLAVSIILGVRLAIVNKELAAKTEELNYYLEIQSELALESENEVEESVTVSLTDSSVPEKVDLPKELTKAEIEELKLSDEELYDGYRKVYLTFDDGPSSNTEKILDILAEYDVKATFFVLQKEGRNMERLYQRIADEGHSIGMHSTDHVYSTVYKSEEAFLIDTKKIRDYIYLVTGVESNIYRFPGGSSNRVSTVDMHVFANALKLEGIKYYDWNVSSQDASVNKLTSAQITKNVTSRIEHYDEVIILFHDAQSKDSTVAALPAIIEYIQGMENTVLLPITSDTKPVQHMTVEY